VELDVSGVAVEGLQEVVARLTEERDQLVHALESRIVIEQAKGVLAERYRLTVADAFLLLRKSARSARVRIHDLAGEVVTNPETPQAVIRGMARDNRLRAIAIRERNEAMAERHEAVRSSSAELTDRLTRSSSRPTARVRVTTRSDAVDLAARLSGYRWYLIVPDEEHWEVVVEFVGAPSELPRDLRQRVTQWLSARSLSSIRVRLGDTELELRGT
jgi:ANTAR domain